jgi:hypothetical protein
MRPIASPPDSALENLCSFNDHNLVTRIGFLPAPVQLGCVLLVFLHAGLLAAGAADGRIVVADFSQGTNEYGVPKTWQLTKRSGRADFSLVKTNGLDALVLRSQSASFSFEKEVTVDLREYPVMCWKWKAIQLPAGGDFQESKTDDQAAQIILAVSRTKAITYIWDTTAPRGLMTNAPAPPFMTIKAVVVRSGSAETGKWLTETRNVYEDCKGFFGEGDDPIVISGIRLQINSQHTKTAAESAFAEIEFRKQ